MPLPAQARAQQPQPDEAQEGPAGGAAAVEGAEGAGEEEAGWATVLGLSGAGDSGSVHEEQEEGEGVTADSMLPDVSEVRAVLWLGQLVLCCVLACLVE